MEIIYKGLSCFQIKAKAAKLKKVSILIDPFFEHFKKKPKASEAEILLLTQNLAFEAKGSLFLIDGAGEYEIQGVFIQGIEVKGAIIYTILAEGIGLCHLGSFSQKEINSELLEKIGDIDILMVPVGAGLSLEAASHIISQIEPRIVIPMQYSLPDLKTKLGKLKPFLEILGLENSETLDKLKIAKKDLPGETKIIVLKVK